MTKALIAANQSLLSSGVLVLVFAHKTTVAWETLVQSLLSAGLQVTASWPLHTEMTGGMVKTGKAVLASSVFLVCRKRSLESTTGHWDDVRQNLNRVARERLDFFWNQGIRGADFFISAIGPALSVFGQYERVTKLSGEEVTVGQFLDEVRGLVTNYALTKIMKTTHTAHIDPDSRFYVVWKWSYGEAKVPADESFKMAQALGMDTESMWDRTGVLEKSGENVAAVPVAKRMKVKDLGDPAADGTPASLIQRPAPPLRVPREGRHRGHGGVPWPQRPRAELRSLGPRPGHQRNPARRRQGKAVDAGTLEPERPA